MNESALAPDAAMALPGARATAIAWRARGMLYVTIVAKATFAFASDAPMPRTEPEEILRADGRQGSDLGGSARLTTDVAPALARADVLFTGSVHAPPGAPVRLAIFADQRPLLNKRLLVQPGCLAGFGPPGAVPHRALEGPIVEIPDGFDWSSFQAAPLDQQTELLRGDEWILLEGLHPSQLRFRTRLPGARGAARVHGLSAFGVSEGQALDLYADTLRIDGDAQRCTVVWRRSFPVPSEAALAVVRVVAGVAVGGATLSWIEPRAVQQAAAEPAPAKATSPTGTVTLSPLAIEQARRQVALRFRPGPADPAVSSIQGKAEPAPSTGTAPLAPADVEALRARKALPFEERAASGPKPAAREPSIETTFEISPELAKAAGPASALPFRKGPSALAQPEPRASTALAEPKSTGTVELGNAGVLAREALPFGPPSIEQAAIVEQVAPPPAPIAPPVMSEAAAPRDALAPLALPPTEAPTTAPRTTSPAAPKEDAELPLNEYPLERCARIDATLSRHPDDAEAILEAHALSGATWEALQAHYDAALADESRRGQNTLLRAYDEAYVAQLEAERGPVSTVDYARIKVAMERGTGEEVLAEMGIPRSARIRLQRLWLQRIIANKALAAEARVTMRTIRLAWDRPKCNR